MLYDSAFFFVVVALIIYQFHFCPLHVVEPTTIACKECALFASSSERREYVA